MYQYFFIYSYVGEHQGCFHVLAIVTRAAMIIGLHVSFILESLFIPRIYPEIELLNHMVAPFLIFQGTSIMFSMAAPPAYIPTNSAGVIPFLHTLSNICYLKIF